MRSSIVWKMTLFFVGVLVTLTCAVLSGVAYFATSRILRDEIHDRLSTVASDRQEMLAYTLAQQEERATRFASKSPIHRLMTRRAEGTVSDEIFRAEADSMLSFARLNFTGFLALWVEDEAGKMLATSGPDDLVAAYSRLRQPGARPDNSLVVPPRRVGEMFGFVFRSVVRGRDGQDVGSVFMVSDFGPIAEFLMDTSGLDETGEVLVGVDEGKAVRLVLPSRRPSTVTELTTRDFPASGRGDRGTVWLQSDDRLSGPGRCGCLSPGGPSFSRLGVDRQDRRGRGVRAGRPAALAALGPGRGCSGRLLGLAASNAIARRVARPIRRLARTASAVAAGDLER